MNVLLTGATGFVGRAVLAELVREGHHVSALVRGPDPAKRLAAIEPAARAVAGDLEDEASLVRALSGMETVLHLAAAVAPALQADRTLVDRINADAAVRLGELARRAGLRRFVFASSIAAMGFWSGEATAESPCRPVSDYGRAKLRAERGLLSLGAAGFDVVVLRPPTVYGPGEPYNFLQWVRAVHRGAFRIIGRGENAFPLATTTNVARTVRAAAEGRLDSGVALVADREPYSVARIHRAMLRVLGKPAPRIRIPRPAALIAGAVNERLARVVPGLPLLLTPARVRTLTVDQRFDVEPLLRSGVDLDAPLEEWVDLTIRDYRRRGLLP